jgi:hypothetical protein
MWLGSHNGIPFDAYDQLVIVTGSDAYRFGSRTDVLALVDKYCLSRSPSKITWSNLTPSPKRWRVRAAGTSRSLSFEVDYRRRNLPRRTSRQQHAGSKEQRYTDRSDHSGWPASSSARPTCPCACAFSPTSSKGARGTGARMYIELTRHHLSTQRCT